jgi:hypothetical protein
MLSLSVAVNTGCDADLLGIRDDDGEVRILLQEAWRLGFQDFFPEILKEEDPA